ncbi:hypothetical protein Rhal01_02567 [Rubritalea halochordaticola]|uniref:Uncharacterized protein n=1 Tax=Rubritalea halochordaticola TaxID=714537 RepID=A0ABP9V476_9BACT
MKAFVATITSFLALTSMALCSGYEYHETVCGLKLGGWELGLQNFRHISHGDYEGKLVLKPFATITLPCRAELFLGISLCVLTILLLLVIGYIRAHKRHKVTT